MCVCTAALLCRVWMYVLFYYWDFGFCDDYTCKHMYYCDGDDMYQFVSLIVTNT